MQDNWIVSEFVTKMKINNCKLCDTFDQKLSGDKNVHCRHTAAAAFISPNHIRDFLAFQVLLRGNYDNFTSILRLIWESLTL